MKKEYKGITAQLMVFDSCTLSDALDALSLPPAVTGLSRLATDKKIAGPVVTVLLEKGSVNTDHHLCTAAIDAAKAGDVIVVQQSTGVDAAGWGGILSTGASIAEIAGVIVEGPARDIDEARQLGFPIYARTATSRTARGRIYERDFNCPIKVGEVDLVPGDYVLADSSGVVFIPAARIKDVLDMADEIFQKEQGMVKKLHEGKKISEVMTKKYERMLD